MNPNMPLDMDLATIKTDLPLLADGRYELRIEKVEVKPTKDGLGKYLSLDHVTITPAKSNTGEDLGPGIHVFNNVNTVPTGKATPEMVARNVGQLVQAAKLPPGSNILLNNVDQWHKQLEGRTVIADVRYVPEGVAKNGQAFKAKNEVTQYRKSV